jgi:hypothetical protein
LAERIEFINGLRTLGLGGALRTTIECIVLQHLILPYVLDNCLMVLGEEMAKLA